MLLPKVSAISTLVVTLASPILASSASSHLTPHRVAFGSLVNANANAAASTSQSDATQLLLEGLTRDGLVSITDIPSFGKTKRALMSRLHACISDVDSSEVEGVQTQTFPDGTVRRSFAASTNLLEGSKPIKALEEFEALSSKHSSVSCREFEARLSGFRSSVDDAMAAFAARLSEEMGSSLPRPLLSSPNQAYESIERVDYDDIAQVVAGGEHLEHFHSYRKTTTTSSGEANDEKTIEFHTDQGFFIAFTPGLVVSADGAGGGDASSELSGGFYVRGPGGEKMLVEFSDEDDLVFMMGDGVNQFINDKLMDDRKVLRAAPHALSLPAHDDSKVRVWYGRMALPPSNAYSPKLGSTFGEARQILVDSTLGGHDAPLGIGCSSPDMQALIHTSRHLNEECTNDELFCWYRCMSLVEHGAVTCEGKRQLEGDELQSDQSEYGVFTAQCVNPRGQVHPDGYRHGDFYPKCTDHTAESHPVTPYPSIDQPGPEVCTAEVWDDFLGDSYDHSIAVNMTDYTNAVLQWSVVDESNIKARLAYNGVFGYVSFGYANPGGKHNGMNGAHVLMAIPGGDYSMVTGFDLDVDPSIGTYFIDEDKSSFRHWSDPVAVAGEELATSGADFEETQCHTALTFEGDHIGGKYFNVSGTDDLQWAGNHEDHFAGYHGKNRRRFTVNWATAEVAYFDEMVVEEEEEHDGSDGDEEEAEEADEPAEPATNDEVVEDKPEPSTNDEIPLEPATNDEVVADDEAEVAALSAGSAKSVFLGVVSSFALAMLMHR